MSAGGPESKAATAEDAATSKVTPALSISPEKVCFIVVKAREFDAKDMVTIPDEASNATDDAMMSVREDHTDDPVVADGLSRMASSLTTPLDVLVEVDSGLQRVGLAPGEESAALALAVAGLPGLRLRGLLTHAGHAYRARSPEEREQIAMGEAAALVQTAELLADHGIDASELSLGSTPTLASIEAVKAAYPAITEIRPGTYAFNDANLIALGVATEANCALSVLVTVVSRPAADRMVVDAGSKTLAADPGRAGGFGRVVNHPDHLIETLSEEHAVIRLPPDADWRIGDRLEVIPNHACPVPNLADTLLGVRHGQVEREIRVDARGRNR